MFLQECGLLKKTSIKENFFDFDMYRDIKSFLQSEDFKRYNINDTESIANMIWDVSKKYSWLELYTELQNTLWQHEEIYGC